MSMRAGLGAAPSNFTVPFTEAEASTGPAQLGISPTVTDRAARAKIGTSADFNFMENLPF